MAFIFDANKGQTPQSIALQRELALRMIGQIGQMPARNVGEGIGSALASLGNGFVARSINRRADAAEQKGMDAAAALKSQLFGGQGLGVAQSPDASGGSAGYQPTGEAGEVESYIRQSAAQRGIDPDTAVNVAMSEGGVTDPFRQSDVVKDGVREESFGPLQLYMGGGLGNEALAAGIDPRKDWKGGVDFGLDHASKNGWGAWYGAGKAGIGNMEGIGGQQPVQVTQQGGQPTLQQLSEIVSHPFMDAGTKAVASTMLAQQMKGPEVTDTMRNLQWRANQAGLRPGTKEYQQFMTSGGQGPQSVINVNNGEGGEFFKELDKGNAQMFQSLQQEGINAGQTMVRLDRLEGLLGNIPTGATANFQKIAGDWGIDTEGLDNIQAAQALINQLVPQQRPAGSGPMSDADLELFKQSVPRVINQPGGNRIILDTMRGIAEYSVQQGQIADAVANREMSPADGRKALAGLRNPLAGYGSAGRGRAVPPGAADMLRADPSLAEQFNTKYGAGSAERILGGQ